MSGILTNIELEVEADLKKIWNYTEGTILQDAGILWADLKVILAAFMPTVYTQIKGFVTTALTKMEGGDISVSALETEVIQLAEAAGAEAVTALKGKLLPAIIGLVVAAIP